MDIEVFFVLSKQELKCEPPCVVETKTGIEE